MLSRDEMSFNSDAVKYFETLMIDCWNPDDHYLTDKIEDEEYGWVYKIEQVEEEFILYLNILYSMGYHKEFNPRVGNVGEY